MMRERYNTQITLLNRVEKENKLATEELEPLIKNTNKKKK